jgi:hypothetical protein
MSTVPPKPSRGIRILSRACHGNCLSHIDRPAAPSGEGALTDLEAAVIESHTHLLTTHEKALRQGVASVWVVNQAEVLSELMVLPLLKILRRADVGHGADDGTDGGGFRRQKDGLVSTSAPLDFGTPPRY